LPNLIRLATLVAYMTTLGMRPPTEPRLETASTHPMQYYVSLPDGWTPQRQWPVLIAIDGSGKDFLDMARLYAHAAAGTPFVIVSPVVLTNGGTNLRHSPKYRYAAAVWDNIDKTGACAFDLDGLAAVIADVQQRDSGRPKVYITGFSAGAHAMWAIVFHRPDLLAAAAPASGNYNGRCVTDDGFSVYAGRAGLPIEGILGDDELGRGLDTQFERAKGVATTHGYTNISREIVAGEHDPHADAVVKFFRGLLDVGAHR
jgi:poly(3-hydroxybutyrate) depolymerase